MTKPDLDKVEVLRRHGWTMWHRTPGKRLVLDAEGRYREVGQEEPVGQAFLEGRWMYLWQDGTCTPVEGGPVGPSEAPTPGPRGV